MKTVANLVPLQREPDLSADWTLLILTQNRYMLAQHYESFAFTVLLIGPACPASWSPFSTDFYLTASSDQSNTQWFQLDLDCVA